MLTFKKQEVKSPLELKVLLKAQEEGFEVNSNEQELMLVESWFISYSPSYSRDTWDDSDKAYLNYATDLFEDTQKLFVKEGDILVPKDAVEIKDTDQIFEYAYFDITEKVHDLKDKFNISLAQAIEVESWGTDDEEYIRERLQEG